MCALSSAPAPWHQPGSFFPGISLRRLTVLPQGCFFWAEAVPALSLPPCLRHAERVEEPASAPRCGERHRVAMPGGTGDPQLTVTFKDPQFDVLGQMESVSQMRSSKPRHGQMGAAVVL